MENYRPLRKSAATIPRMIQFLNDDPDSPDYQAQLDGPFYRKQILEEEGYKQKLKVEPKELVYFF